MKVENADVLAARLGGLVMEAKRAISFLNRFKHVESVVATVDANQKNHAMSTLDGMATGINSAYDLAAEAFTSSETIVETKLD